MVQVLQIQLAQLSRCFLRGAGSLVILARESHVPARCPQAGIAYRDQALSPFHRSLPFWIVFLPVLTMRSHFSLEARNRRNVARSHRVTDLPALGYSGEITRARIVKEALRLDERRIELGWHRADALTMMEDRNSLGWHLDAKSLHDLSEANFLN
jgi:hypothetical protein